MTGPREISTESIDMPLCPLCDHGMQHGEEPVEIVVSKQGALGLAHTWCVDDLDEKETTA